MRVQRDHKSGKIREEEEEEEEEGAGWGISDAVIHPRTKHPLGLFSILSPILLPRGSQFPLFSFSSAGICISCAWIRGARGFRTAPNDLLSCCSSSLSSRIRKCFRPWFFLKGWPRDSRDLYLLYGHCGGFIGCVTFGSFWKNGSAYFPNKGLKLHVSSELKVITSYTCPGVLKVPMPFLWWHRHTKTSKNADFRIDE